MSLLLGEAGIDCTNCGHVSAVKTRRDCENLEKALEWFEGNPVCPECGDYLTFEDYIDNEDEPSEGQEEP